MTKRLFILFFMLTGFMVLPKLSAACSMESGMEDACCRKTPDAQQKTVTSQCKEHKTGNHKKDKHDCDGGCCPASCHSPATSVLTVFSTSDSLFENFKTGLTAYFSTKISSGFSSVWIPPKIG